MKIKLTLLGLAIQLLGAAQTPQLFRGGAGDGKAKGGYTQTSVAFWLGGDGDGATLAKYAQTSTGFWLGGEGDGFANAKYAQPSTLFWLGGEGDGFSRTNYTQASTAFWLGGEGDGHADSGYAQASTAFWLGGPGDGWASTYIPSRALPVTFGNFEVSKKSTTEALLKWDTETEANSSHFDIERSADAITFTKIGDKKAAGNSNSTINYSFVDAKVLNGNNYYRLKQVDRNGQFVYTPTRMVRFDALAPAAISLYPNPATNLANVVLSANMLDQRLVINMMDVKGNVVKQWKINQVNQLNLQLSLNGLPRGTYLLHFSGQNLNTTQKLLLQ